MYIAIHHRIYILAVAIGEVNYNCVKFTSFYYRYCLINPTPLQNRHISEKMDVAGFAIVQSEEQG